MNTIQNTIKRDIIIDATKEQIYDAISSPDQVVKWFPETLEGEYKVGSQLIFSFGEKFKNQIYVVAATPHKYFAFRWVPGSDNFEEGVLTVPNTLVEFQIQEISINLCKVTLTESGFEKLPAEVIESAIAQNSGGWDFMMGRLQKLFDVA